MLHQEDLTKILGERPFKHAELSNYDKFKLGFAPSREDAAKQGLEDGLPADGIPPEQASPPPPPPPGLDGAHPVPVLI